MRTKLAVQLSGNGLTYNRIFFDVLLEFLLPLSIPLLSLSQQYSCGELMLCLQCPKLVVASTPLCPGRFAMYDRKKNNILRQQACAAFFLFGSVYASFIFTEATCHALTSFSQNSLSYGATSLWDSCAVRLE